MSFNLFLNLKEKKRPIIQVTLYLDMTSPSFAPTQSDLCFIFIFLTSYSHHVINFSGTELRFPDGVTETWVWHAGMYEHLKSPDRPVLISRASRLVQVIDPNHGPPIFSENRSLVPVLITGTASDEQLL